jgi:hypothetical protein
MNCEFLSENCFLTKKPCPYKGKESHISCKYYIRQNPPDKLDYMKRFKKALQVALEKRDFFEEYRRIMDDVVPNFDKSIYSNIQEILKSIEPYEIEIKGKKDLKKEDLQGDILHNILKGIKSITKIKILQQFRNKDQLLIEENGKKSLVTLKGDTHTFMKRIKNKDKDDKSVYFKKKVVDKVNLS